MQGSIILIDDDEDDQQFILSALNDLKLSNKLNSFYNGEAALNYLKETNEQPFLILCDINMPLMNGLELKNRISKDEHLRVKCIPFIFLTTSGSPDYVRVAYEEAVQGYYVKSNNYRDLVDQLRLIVTYWKSCLHPNSRQ